MINPFSEVDVEIAHDNKYPKLNWINIVGAGKVGKTETLVKLQEKYRVAYFDFENGTSPYHGYFININNYNDFKIKINSIFTNIKKINPDIIVVDPFDALVEMIFSHIAKKHNADDLKDIKIKGIGNGWSLLYNEIDNVVSTIKGMCRIFLSITHLKLSVISKNETSQVTHLDYNLVGQAKAFVNDKADANILFSKGIDKETKEFRTLVSMGSNDGTMITTFGGRGGIMHQLSRCNDSKDFLTFIDNQLTTN